MFSVEEFVKWLEAKNVGILKAIKTASKYGKEYLEAVMEFYDLSLNL